MIYSYSRLNRFENCPMAFKLKYIDRVKVEFFESIESFTGSRVHEALERLYDSLRKGFALSVDEILMHYGKQWGRNIRPDVVVNKEGLTHDHYRTMGEKCITDYYSCYKPFREAKTVATEQRITVDLLGDKRYRFVGYIDRIDTRGNGIYEIHDYKTGQRLPTQEMVDGDRQLGLYAIGLRQMYDGVRDVDLVWHYLAFDKEIRLKRSDNDLEDLKVELIGAVQQIEKAVQKDNFPAIESGLCNWCEFQGVCTKKEHTVKTQQQSLSDYTGNM